MNRVVSFVVVTVLCVRCLETAAVFASPGDLLLTIPNPTPSADDLFGTRLAVVGNYIVATDFRDDVNGFDAGAAYMFDGDTGQLVHTFVSPIAPVPKRFGVWAASLGNTIWIGADGDFASDGKVFGFDATTKSLVTQINNPTSIAGETFGGPIIPVGENILVTDDFDSSNVSKAGATYLFDQNGTLLHTFENPTPDIGDRFGEYLATFDNDILIGCIYADVSADDAGVVYLFDGQSKNLLHVFLNPFPNPGDGFGARIATFDNRILISSPNGNGGTPDSGVVYMYDGSTRNLIHTINNPTPEAGDNFGSSIAIVGDYIAIGAWGDNSDGNLGGAVYLFDQSGSLVRTFHNPTPEVDDNFGEFVVALGNKFVTGAQHDHFSGNQGGAVYVFEAIPEPSSFLLCFTGLVTLRSSSLRYRKQCQRIDSVQVNFETALPALRKLMPY